MFGLTSLGVVHTAISLVALAAGVLCFVRYKEIPAGSALGQTYIWTTVLTCLTGFGIFQHGGFGKPHALGVLTLVVLGLAALARGSADVPAVCTSGRSRVLRTDATRAGYRRIDRGRAQQRADRRAPRAQ